MENELLANTWFELVGPQENSHEILATIIDRYNSPGRFYHNTGHIDSLLLLYANYSIKLKDKAVRFGIILHDVIYHPGSADNEQASATYAENTFSKLKVPAGKVERVCNYIMATKNHFLYTGDDMDLKYFLDFDLAILASPRDLYMRYADNIRKEFSNFDDEIYRNGRIQFIDTVLAMEKIYFTSDFEQHEDAARENLTWERSHLTTA